MYTIYIYIYKYTIQLSLSLYIYIYIYTYISIHICTLYFMSQGFCHFSAQSFARVRHLRKSPQYLLVILQDKSESPQISAILRNTFTTFVQTNVQILAREIP